MEMLQENVRKMKAVTVNMETWHWLVKTDRIQHELWIKF
jgi:hypothetical protein